MTDTPIRHGALAVMPNPGSWWRRDGGSTTRARPSITIEAAQVMVALGGAFDTGCARAWLRDQGCAHDRPGHHRDPARRAPVRAPCPPAFAHETGLTLVTPGPEGHRHRCGPAAASRPARVCLSMATAQLTCSSRLAACR